MEGSADEEDSPVAAPAAAAAAAPAAEPPAAAAAADSPQPPPPAAAAAAAAPAAAAGGGCLRKDEYQSGASARSASTTRRLQINPTATMRTSRSRYDPCCCNSSLEAAASAAAGTGAGGCLKRLKARVAEFLSDLFGSEFDFGAAYRRAKGLGDGYQSSITVRTDQQEQVKAADHLTFFPLTFKEKKFEKQYGLICSQLFIGRLFLVLIAIIFLVIPVMWLLGSRCFIDVGLDTQSWGAWLAFHLSFLINFCIAVCSLVLIIFPKIWPSVRRHFELYAYANVLLWLCILLIVLATFPKLVTVPSQMELLWNADSKELAAIIKAGHPLCSALKAATGVDLLLNCIQAGTDFTTCAAQCQGNAECVAAAFSLVGTGATYCQQMSEAVSNNFGRLGTELRHLYFPFAFYLPYVKVTLQVFKTPLVALALIVCVFGTGLMFLDAMSPSRTKLTILMHLLVIPLCSLPFVLLHATYPTVVPFEET
ncbi:hypothetical protein, conserved [Eimeria brunetti]|uniref:Uncharacterized protein n=1 Tax=Eimeria brunetti TaxID=51314 RepID=U6LPX9_9EIME|nr:hypothetical protein, conserved [Eimeria brunetti]